MPKARWLALALSVLPAAGQPQIRPIEHPPGGPLGLRAKGRAPQGLRRGEIRPMSVTFPGDNVIPQIAEGAGWQTTLRFVNLDARNLTFSVYFFDDDGKDLTLDIVGVGPTTGLEVQLPMTEAITIETSGSTAQLRQGFAYVVRDAIEDVLGGFCVYRSRVEGRPDFEAVVPISSEFDKRFVMLYDNARGYVTSMAIANPSTDTIEVDAVVRDEDANVLERKKIALGPFQHRAFTLPTQWPSTTNKRGVIEFQSTGWGASVMGLLFNPRGAFTSFHVLSNPDW